MPSLAMLRIPRPSDSKEFEELCKDYLKYRYNAEVQSYGRLGQDQKGIDIIVTLKDNSVICAQCKDVNKATVRDLDEWILEAEEFGYPMREFVIMVAVNNDTKLQDHILEVNKLRTQNRKAPVKLVFWDDVVEFIKKDPKIFSSYFPDLFSAMNEEHHWDDTKRIRKFSEKELKQENIRKFLSGRNSGRKYWELITSNQIVRREIVDTLLNKIDSPGIYVLTGAGGEGKTTALMQLGSELIKKGESVFFCNGYKPLPLPDPSSIKNGSFFLLDNALGVASFLQLLEKMQELIDDKDASFILVARENEWNLMENDTPEYRTYYSGYVKKIPMGHVTKDESYLFAKCIKANLHISKDENQIQKIFQENSYGFLYASMLLSVSEKNTLDEVASDIINNLEQKSFDSLLILAFTVMSEHYNAKVNKALFKKLCAKYNRNERRVCSSLSKELVENAGIFQTRHPVISELFYQEILGHLLQVELDGVIENLVLLRLELSKKLSGALRWSYWTGIKAVMGSISLAGIDSQAHILQRLLDEIKEDVPYDFDSLFDLLESRESQSIFIKICYERDRLSPRNLRKWALQDLTEQPWDYSIPYSAAWLYRGIYDRLSEDNMLDGYFWLNWAAFEKQYRGLGKSDQENSARWIFREACINHNRWGISLWIAWGRLEAENGNLGDYDQENSARWILRKACMEHNLIDGSIWSAWGKLEEGEGDIGKYDENNEAKPENSARWIYREACVNRGVLAHIVWKEWGRLEEENGNIGDYNQENSARWILSTGIHNNPKDRYNLTVALAIMELKNGFVENARRVLEMNYLNNGSINGLLTILTIICGNGEKGPLLDDLIIELKNPKRSAMGYLYYCYLLQGDATSAESVLEALRIQSINPLLSEKFRNQVNTFITLCRLANESKPITDEENINAFFIDEEIEI